MPASSSNHSQGEARRGSSPDFPNPRMRSTSPYRGRLDRRSPSTDEVYARRYTADSSFQERFIGYGVRVINIPEKPMSERAMAYYSGNKTKVSAHAKATDDKTPLNDSAEIVYAFTPPMSLRALTRSQIIAEKVEKNDTEAPASKKTPSAKKATTKTPAKGKNGKKVDEPKETEVVKDTDQEVALKKSVEKGEEQDTIPEESPVAKKSNKQLASKKKPSKPVKGDESENPEDDVPPAPLKNARKAAIPEEESNIEIESDLEEAEDESEDESQEEPAQGFRVQTRLQARVAKGEPAPKANDSVTKTPAPTNTPLETKTHITKNVPTKKTPATTPASNKSMPGKTPTKTAPKTPARKETLTKSPAQKKSSKKNINLAEDDESENGIEANPKPAPLKNAKRSAPDDEDDASPPPAKKSKTTASKALAKKSTAQYEHDLDTPVSKKAKTVTGAMSTKKATPKSTTKKTAGTPSTSKKAAPNPGEKSNKPMNAYLLFCNSKDGREKVRKDNPDITNKQLTSELGRLWKEMKDDHKVKKKYLLEAIRLKDEYEEAIAQA